MKRKVYKSAGVKLAIKVPENLHEFEKMSHTPVRPLMDSYHQLFPRTRQQIIIELVKIAKRDKHVLEALNKAVKRAVAKVVKEELS